MCPALTALTGAAAFHLPTMATGAAASRGIGVRSVPFCASISLTTSDCLFFMFVPVPWQKWGECAEGAVTGAQSGSGSSRDMLRG